MHNYVNVNENGNYCVRSRQRNSIYPEIFTALAQPIRETPHNHHSVPSLIQLVAYLRIMLLNHLKLAVFKILRKYSLITSNSTYPHIVYIATGVLELAKCHLL